MAPDPRALVEHYYGALNRHDLDALDAIVAPDFERHEPGAIHSLIALKDTLAAFQAGFPDISHVVEDTLVDGDRVMVRTVTTGTHLGSFLGHAPTGRRFSATALSVYRIGVHLIRECWSVFDTLAMLQQLGLYTPSPVLPPDPGRSGPDSSPRSGQRSPGRQPPGPAQTVTVADVRSEPLAFLQRLIREYGDIVRYVCDGRVTILLNRPEAVKHVLHDHAVNYSKLSTPDLLLLKPMLGEGLLTTEGASWKRDRQSIQSLFARRRIERFGELMVQVTEEMLGRWEARPDTVRPLDIVHEMSRLTVEIVARALLSSDLSSKSESFGQAMRVLNESMAHVRPDSPEVEERFVPALATIRRIVWQPILSRKIYDSGEDDAVALLLQAQRARGDLDEHVLDQAVTLLLAGHETTAKALSWTFALLDQHAEASDRVLAELGQVLAGRPPTVTDLPALKLTQAVIHESLRLFPPIWLLSRTAMRDDVVAAYTVPAGALVLISPYLIHRHPTFWDRPEQFLPERFLNDEHEAAALDHRYLPFSVGPRHCLGKWFALLEIPLALATIHPRYKLQLPDGHPVEPEALVTLRPRYGLPMVATARLSQPRGAGGNEKGSGR